MRALRRFVSLMMLLCCAARHANAQVLDLSGAYAFFKHQQLREKFGGGWVAGAAGHLTERFAVGGEVAGHYTTSKVFGNGPRLVVHSFMIGPRFSARTSTAITPFAHFLVGAVHIRSSHLGSSGSGTEVAIQPGGGADVWFAPHLAARVGGDYRRTFGNAASNQLRFHAGLVFALGRE
jgi:hypothetical protein